MFVVVSVIGGAYAAYGMRLVSCPAVGLPVRLATDVPASYREQLKAAAISTDGSVAAPTGSKTPRVC
jgi:hypothetical protein